MLPPEHDTNPYLGSRGDHRPPPPVLGAESNRLDARLALLLNEATAELPRRWPRGQRLLDHHRELPIRRGRGRAAAATPCWTAPGGRRARRAKSWVQTSATTPGGPC